MEVKKPTCVGFFIQLNCKKSDEITYQQLAQLAQLAQLQQQELVQLQEQLQQQELELELVQLQQLELVQQQVLEQQQVLQQVYRHKRSKQETTGQLQEQKFSFYFLGS